MPCFYTGSELGDLKLSMDETQDKLNKTTNMLCELLLQIEATVPEIITANKKISEWWEHHKKLDFARKLREREEEEMVIRRNKALDKLSENERRALGLDWLAKSTPS